MVAVHRVDEEKARGEEPCLFPKLEKYIEYLLKNENSAVAENFSMAELLDQVEQLQKAIVRFPSPTVFCHNDLLIHNVIYDEEKSID